MKTFKTERPKILLYLLKEFLFYLLILTLCGLIANYINPHVTLSTGCFMLVIFLLAKLVEESSKDRAYEIQFDTAAGLIIIYYKYIFTNSDKRILTFNETTVKTNANNRLSFTVKTKEIFYLTKSKDGFSIETLKEIYNYARSVNINQGTSF